MQEVTAHDVKLAGCEEVALGTMAFHFSKPAGVGKDDIRTEEFFGY